jgi:ribosomal protein S18 acetylase RimI-like enzyme
VIRRAAQEDAGDVGRLLDAFNREYDEPTDGPDVLAERAIRRMAEGDITFLLAGDEPFGIAQVRLFRSMWSDGLHATLDELYVAPDRRGEGHGRALLEAAIELARERGAENIELNTSEDDTAALALYESAGFTNREGRPDGPTMLYFEREL